MQSKVSCSQQGGHDGEPGEGREEDGGGMQVGEGGEVVEQPDEGGGVTGQPDEGGMAIAQLEEGGGAPTDQAEEMTGVTEQVDTKETVMEGDSTEEEKTVHQFASACLFFFTLII